MVGGRGAQIEESNSYLVMFSLVMAFKKQFVPGRILTLVTIKSLAVPLLVRI